MRKSEPKPLQYFCNECYADRGGPCVNTAGRPLPDGAVHRPRMQMATEMAKLRDQAEGVRDLA